MITKEKRAYLLIASEEGFQKLIVTIEKILSKQNNSYVHAFLMLESENNNQHEQLCELRTEYYNRLILKDAKPRHKFVDLLKLWKANNIFKSDLIKFINNYKDYAEEELYILIGNEISIEKFKEVLDNHLGKSSLVTYDTMDKYND